jgi:hypothetical protein
VQPLGRRRPQPRAALLLHGRLRGSAGRAVHVGRPQGLAAQRRGEWLFEQVNATGTDFPAGLSEAEEIGVALERSEVVDVPRVAQSPVAVECTLHSMVRLGDSTVVFGHVLHISAWESTVRDGRPRIEELKPLARLGGNEWSTIGEVKEIARIPYRKWSEDPSIAERLRRR